MLQQQASSPVHNCRSALARRLWRTIFGGGGAPAALHGASSAAGRPGAVEHGPGAPPTAGCGHAGHVAHDDARGPQDDVPLSPACPFTIDRPIMLQRWERLTFVHWWFHPSTVQGLLPAWLRVETFDDVAWVGLVPFFMRVATPGGHRFGWVSNFCETNVRTYVRDREGRSGIWFFSLDAARLGAVITARSTYRLPYFWSRMRLDERGDDITYTCRRRWPDPCSATSRVQVRISEPLGAAELDRRDHFLTARWVLFSSAGDRTRFARASHAPGPLYRADVVDVDDQLIIAAGLPSAQHEPIVHYSPGVDVRIGRPQRYGSDA
jgi:uncharacterized protein YqjF (DUF2071 family)